MSEKASTALFIRKICHTRKVQYIIMTHYKNLTCQSAWCIITTLNVLYRRSVAKMKQGDVSLDKSGLIISIRCFLKEQSGFNVIGFFFFVVIIVLLAVIVIPNVYRFFGKQTISEQANAETSSIRVTANSYEINPGTYPANSNALWNNPLGLNDMLRDGAPLTLLLSATVRYCRPLRTRTICQLIPGWGFNGTGIPIVGYNNETPGQVLIWKGVDPALK